MNKSRFAIGDKVICIAEDGFGGDTYPIGKIFTVDYISNEGQANECLSFVETRGIGGPYSRKFEPYTDHRMIDPDFDLDEIHLAQELIEG